MGRPRRAPPRRHGGLLLLLLVVLLPFTVVPPLLRLGGDASGLAAASSTASEAQPPPYPRRHLRPRPEKAIGGPVDIDNRGFAKFKELRDFVNLAMALSCVLCAAIASGLTIGLLSIDQLELEIKEKVGTPDEVWQAQRILPVLRRRHLLLVTLLLFNSVAAEALPLALDELVPGYVAVLISVTAVLIFGEILPSAIFSGPGQLRIGARMTGLVWCLMIFFFPFAYPISWCLDHFVGGDHGEAKRYSRLELAALIEIHEERLHLEQEKEEQVRAKRREKAGQTRRRRRLWALLGWSNGHGSGSSHSNGNGDSGSVSSPPPPHAVLPPPQQQSEGDKGLVNAQSLEGQEEGESGLAMVQRNADSVNKPPPSLGQPSQSSLVVIPGDPLPPLSRDASAALAAGAVSRQGSTASTSAFSAVSPLRAAPAPPSTPTPSPGGLSHAASAPAAPASSSLLTAREVSMAVGVLKIATKTARDCLVPWDEVYCLSSEAALDDSLLAAIRAAGYSRIPVYDPLLPQAEEGGRETAAGAAGARRQLRGYVLTKRLITLDPKEGRRVGSLALQCPLTVSPDCPLIDVLNAFQRARSHLALVCPDPVLAMQCLVTKAPMPWAPLGIVTLEDVMEEVLQSEIMDEMDDSRQRMTQGGLGLAGGSSGVFTGGGTLGRLSFGAHQLVTGRIVGGGQSHLSLRVSPLALPPLPPLSADLYDRQEQQLTQSRSEAAPSLPPRDGAPQHARTRSSLAAFFSSMRRASSAASSSSRSLAASASVSSLPPMPAAALAAGGMEEEEEGTEDAGDQV